MENHGGLDLVYPIRLLCLGKEINEEKVIQRSFAHTVGDIPKLLMRLLTTGASIFLPCRKTGREQKSTCNV
jgi:hypothetical protein